MESQNSVILASCEEETGPILLKKIVENINHDLEEHYFSVSSLQKKSEEMQILENEDEMTKISRMCRICATITDHLVPIFKADGLEQNLSNKIHRHLPIKVCESDNLPLHLCYHCAAILLAWDELFEGVLAAQNRLLQLQEQAEQKAVNQNKEFDISSDDKPFIQTELIIQEEERIQNPKNEQAPINETERSSRGQTPIKVFLETQNFVWRRRNETTSDLPENVSSIWINETVPIFQQQSSLDACDGELKDEQQQQQEQYDFVEDSDAESESDQLNFNCKSCSMVFESAADLNKHEKIHKSWVPYQCLECGRGFKLKDSFLRHSRIHKDERPYTCHVCGKQFRDSGGLARHLRDVHAKLKKFPCDLCESSFASKATRDDHRRTHTGERPYVCDCCGKTFKSKASLYIHSKIHTDEFPHSCSYCAKKFRRKQEMLIHVSTHTGEKNYECQVCKRRFRVKSELTRHQLIHSEDKPFVCNKCGLAFRQKRYLSNHLKSRHFESLRN